MTLPPTPPPPPGAGQPAAPLGTAGPAGAPATAPRRRTALVVALAALLVLVVVAALALPGGPFNPGDDAPAAAPTPTAAPTAEPDPVEPEQPAQPDPAELQAQLDEVHATLVRRDPADPLAVGDPDAPVVMISWADFLCGYCARHALEVEPQLREQYVESGVLRIEWRDLAQLAPESAEAAAAARAAGQQGRFWEYHEALFERQASGGAFDDAALMAVAEGLGLDLAQFDADRTSDAVRTAVLTDTQEAQALGITGTPTFLVNGTVVGGAQPLEYFQQVIEAELARVTDAG